MSNSRFGRGSVRTMERVVRVVRLERVERVERVVRPDGKVGCCSRFFHPKSAIPINLSHCPSVPHAEINFFKYQNHNGNRAVAHILPSVASIVKHFIYATMTILSMLSEFERFSPKNCLSLTGQFGNDLIFFFRGQFSYYADPPGCHTGRLVLHFPLPPYEHTLLRR